MIYEECVKPPYGKMLMFKDVLIYAKKYNKCVTGQLLQTNGFTPLEVNWLLEHAEEIKMQNNEIQFEKNNEEIVRLNKIIESLKQDFKAPTMSDNISTKTEKSSLNIKRLSNNEWLVTEHRRSKNSGKKYKTMHYVDSIHVNNLWRIIRHQTDINNPKTYYKNIVSALMSFYNLRINIDAFNGGRNRNKFLMPLYYYPMKILESLLHIEYGGRGTVTRLVFERKWKI